MTRFVAAPRSWLRALVPVACLHAVGLALLTAGLLGTPGVVTVILGGAGFAYGRGLIHATDVDHISMIDNSLRKFIADGRRATSTVGLAFSAGHSTVVVLTGLLVATGSSITSTLLDPTSRVAVVLGTVGITVSGTYLLLLAGNNATLFAAAWRAHRGVRADPGIPVPDRLIHPTGGVARLLTRPLARVRHARHVFIAGFLFGLGFDTASTIGLLMTGAAAAAGGANVCALLAFPALFASAMTLGDTVNNLVMLQIYTKRLPNPRARLVYNMVVTGLGLVSAVVVGILATCSLLSAGQVGLPVVSRVADLDTQHFGYVLIAGFIAVATIGWIRTRTARPRSSP